MRFGSLFSGIGGFDLGLEQAGWEVLWQVEDDPFCNRILGRHWPKVRRYGDIRTVDASQLGRVDLICGGFPCQDLSVAGKRAGLAGERSGLFWEVVRVARAVQPRWLLIENVPGLFSSNYGDDFQLVLESIEELGYGVAWRVLDSQNFGVPQRRRRVFIVGYLGAPCPPEVLFEPESLHGNTQASCKAGDDVAYPLRTRSQVQGSPERSDVTLITGTVTGAERHNGNSNPVAENYVVHGSLRVGGREQGAGNGPDNTPIVAAPLEEWQQNSGAISALVSTQVDPDGVREASGLPRGLDSPRYRTLGNAVTVPVARWIGARILSAAIAPSSVTTVRKSWR